MKISCEIIKDLLPLYHDGVCSNDSRTLVAEHLAHCDSCKAELQVMNDELSLTDTKKNLNEAETVKRLSKKWKQGMNRSLLKGIVFTIAVIALIILVLYSFMDIKVLPKPY